MRPRKSISYSRKSSIGLRFEGLESRQHMSATSAIQLPAVQMDMINPKLLTAVNETLAGKQNQLVQNKSVRFDATGAVQTYVRTADVDAAAQQLQQLGIKIDASSAEMGVVQAWIAPGMIDDALNIPAIGGLDLPDYAVTNVTSAGDTVHLTDQVRARFNFAGSDFDGTGIKIGVISDGANHRANVGAELPGVTVNPALPGTGDEGTAMLEIVHDLAPGAQLYFSGPGTSVDMVNSINYLKAQGCNVIVDDLLFLGEHFFSDTAVANAAKQAVTDGVVYVTSAGNFGTDQHYQGQYVQGLSAFGGGRLHRFGGPGQEVNQVTIPNGSRFRGFLQWSDAPTTSANNYDLYLFNSNTFAQLDAGLVVQNGNDAPFEFVDWTNNTGANVQAELWVVKKDGAASRELEIITVGNSSMQFDTPSDCLVSQEAIPEVMSVAAVNVASPNNIEPYSSRGGSTIYTNFTTQTKTLRGTTLDGAATDGVQTKVGQLGFFANPFWGTSAAAPHAAAIAALVRDVNPSLTPAQVAQTMSDTAIDLGAVGYDTTFGAGRYHALNAVYKAYTPGTPDLHASSDSGFSNTDNITNDNTPLLAGTTPAGSFVEVFIDGVFESFINQADGVSTWQDIVNPLSDGLHQVTIRVSDSNTVPVANRSLFSQSFLFVVDTTPVALPVGAFQYETQQRLDFDFNEDVSQSLSVNDLQLINHTTLQTIDPLQFNFTYEGGINVGSWTFDATLPDGNYSAVIAQAGVTDVAGNPMTAPAPHEFFVLAGDANRDRSVDIGDFSTLAANFNAAGTFTQGDFDYSGLVDIGDFSILASRFNTTLPAPDASRLMPGQDAASTSLRSSIFGNSRLIEASWLDDVMA